MHMNLNHVCIFPCEPCHAASLTPCMWQTFHIHHSGRSLYTLIKPPSSPDEKPIVKRVIMGANIAAGELLQLYVPGGWWKASEIPAEDLEKASAEDANDKVGCLISEVVCPGWTIDQHKFLTKEKVSRLAYNSVLVV